MEIIERQVGHLSRLVDDLLDVSRITRGAIQLRKEPVELRQAVVRAVEMAAPLLEQRRHPLSLDVPEDGLMVLGDVARLAQVISNLLTNAAKYSDVDAPIELEGRREGGLVRLSVRDAGIGIAPDMLARILEPFVQERQSIERARGGLGLGLAIVRNLVQMHEGTVHVHSAGPGTGSVFTITLPALVQRPLPFPCVPQHLPLQAASSRRVLVVDDDGDAAALLKSALEQNGYTVKVAEDGPSALRAALKFHPDIALLDIGLPVMDGYELGKRLRELGDGRERLRLVALTGYGLKADHERSIAAGFDAHLVKPVDLEALLRVVS
jgi:CheY-like chemotaxis protein/anti-sigma regulatory factor (Ser/Thr protein kinase)